MSPLSTHLISESSVIFRQEQNLAWKAIALSLAMSTKGLVENNGDLRDGFTESVNQVCPKVP